MEQAYRESQGFRNEEHRGARKTTRNVAFIAWAIGRDPNLTWVYLTNREDEAVTRNRWLQSLLISDDHRRVFPQATLLADRSNAGKTTVRGKSNREAPNVWMMGIESCRAGQHVNAGILDDVCDEKSSLAQMARKVGIKRIFYTTVLPYFDDPITARGRLGIGFRTISGTVYAPDDLNGETAQMAKNDPERWLYHRSACGGPPNFDSPCPLILSPEHLRELWNLNPRAYEMNYQLLPISDTERPFRQLYYYLPAGWRLTEKQTRDIGYTPVVLPNSFALGGVTLTWPTLMSIDPGFSSKSGATGMVFGTLAPGGHLLIRYASKKRQPWDRTLTDIPPLFKKYHVTRTLVEEAGSQSTCLFQLRERGIYADAVHPAGRSKEERAAFVGGEVNLGRVLLPGMMVESGGKWSIRPYGEWARELADDLMAFPGIQEKDRVDAFVYLVEAARQGGVPATNIEKKTMTEWQERVDYFNRMIFEKPPQPGEIPELAVFK